MFIITEKYGLASNLNLKSKFKNMETFAQKKCRMRILVCIDRFVYQLISSSSQTFLKSQKKRDTGLMFIRLAIVFDDQHDNNSNDNRCHHVILFVFPLIG